MHGIYQMVTLSPVKGKTRPIRPQKQKSRPRAPKQNSGRRSLGRLSTIQALDSLKPGQALLYGHFFGQQTASGQGGQRQLEHQHHEQHLNGQHGGVFDKAGGEVIVVALAVEHGLPHAAQQHVAAVIDNKPHHNNAQQRWFALVQQYAVAR